MDIFSSTVPARSTDNTRDELGQLATLIRRERDGLLVRWRNRVRELPSAKNLDIPALNDHVPLLIDELADAFQLAAMGEESQGEEILACPPVHSIERFRKGFDLMEVVEEYNILRGCIYDLADENGICLRGRAFHVLCRVFDEAVGVAVQTLVAQQALEARQRREEYLSFVVHDLRTPLNAVALAARALEMSPLAQAGGGTAHMLEVLRRNTQRLESLVEKVLKESAHVQSALDSLERREFDLWPLVEALVHDLHPVAEAAGTRLVNEIPRGMTVYADAAMLKRVFQNLMANAIRHTPRGEVVIDAREKASGGVECRVRDNGIGIAEDRLDTIFDKHKAEPEKHGEPTNGFGLPIVKTLVEAHGGTVTVNSKEGYGAEFRFTLPDRKN
jgi:two-component system, OmpR family, phosphate regulon sensor histidine kinase PhoR